MTLSQSHSTPQRGSRDGQQTWPVLARLPDVSTVIQPAPQRMPQAATATGSVEYRFDAPQLRGPSAGLARTATEGSPNDNQVSQPASKPPHHLSQGAGRKRKAAGRDVRHSPVLPAWDPFVIPGKRLPDSFAPILSFLMLVALFTAAGTLILLLRGNHRPAVTESTTSPARIERTAVSPTAVGPLGSAAKLIPMTRPESTTVAAQSRSATEPMPTTIGTGQEAANRSSDSIDQAIEPVDDDPGSENPEDEFPEPVDSILPPADVMKAPLPVARFSGQIQEALPRQAQHDDQSSIH